MATWSRDLLLGVCDAPCSELVLSPYENKIGGYPDFYPSSTLSSLPNCASCGGFLQLLVQIYCPLEDSVNHRLLHLYCCTLPKCHERSEGWLALRSELKDPTLTTVSDNEPTTDTATISTPSADPKPPLQASTTDLNEWCVDADDWGEVIEKRSGRRIVKSQGLNEELQHLKEDFKHNGAASVTEVHSNRELKCVHHYPETETQCDVTNLTQSMGSLQCTDTQGGVESKCTDTQGEVESKCTDTQGGVESKCTDTQGGVESKCTDTQGGVESKCTDTQGGVESKCTDTQGGVESKCTDTQGGVESKCTDTQGGVESKCTDTQGGVESKCTDTQGGVESKCTDTQGGVESKCTDTQGGVESKCTDTQGEVESKCTDTQGGVESKCTDSQGGVESKCTDTQGGVESKCTQVSFKGPHFESFYLNVVSEPSSEHRDSQRVEQLLQKYRQENQENCNEQEKSKKQCPRNSQGRSDGSKMEQKGGGGERYEKMVAKHGDKAFQKFKKALSLCPSQVLRYNWKGEPLIITDKQRAPLHGEVTCRSCDALAVFEFQLMPPLVYLLQQNQHRQLNEAGPEVTTGSVEFGTVLVYSCSESCWNDRGGGFRQETVFIEADPENKMLNECIS